MLLAIEVPKNHKNIKDILKQSKKMDGIFVYDIDDRLFELGGPEIPSLWAYIESLDRIIKIDDTEDLLHPLSPEDYLEYEALSTTYDPYKGF